MDGRFVPNLSMGPQIVAAPAGQELPGVRRTPDAGKPRPLHPRVPPGRGGCHRRPRRVRQDIAALLAAIRDSGAKPALALKPGTPGRGPVPLRGPAVYGAGDDRGAGFGGQKLIPEALPKIPGDQVPVPPPAGGGGRRRKPRHRPPLPGRRRRHPGGGHRGVPLPPTPPGRSPPCVAEPSTKPRPPAYDTERENHGPSEVLPLGQRIWRLGSPPQPLVFRFAGVSTLCAAVAALYRRCPPAKAWLCLYRGRYYLAVHAGLRARPRAVRAATPYGELLGPARVLYALLRGTRPAHQP